MPTDFSVRKKPSVFYFQIKNSYTNLSDAERKRKELLNKMKRRNKSEYKKYHIILKCFTQYENVL